MLTLEETGIMPRGFVDDRDHLDDVCILSDLNGLAAQALADHVERRFDPDIMDEDSEVILDQAGAVVDALINAGLIRRTDFEYRNGSTVRV